MASVPRKRAPKKKRKGGRQAISSLSATDPKRIERELQLSKILELRLLGHSQMAISRQTGISQSHVDRLLRIALQQVAVKQKAEDVLTVVRERLDLMLVGALPKAMKGIDASIASVLAIENRRMSIAGVDPASKNDRSQDGVLRVVIENDPDLDNDKSSHSEESSKNQAQGVPCDED